MAREGKLNALEIVLDKNREFELVKVYCQAFSTVVYLLMPGSVIWKKESALKYTKLEVTGGAVEGKDAVLNVRALVSGRSGTARVKMILERSQWKVENENWKVD